MQTGEMVEVTPAELVLALEWMMDNVRDQNGRIPSAFVWGPPGCGKTEIPGQLSKRRGIGYIEVNAQHHDPVDLRGMPKVTDDETQWKRPSGLPRDGAGVYLIDDFPMANPSTMNAFAQLALCGRVSEHEIGKDWMVVATGNRLGDRSGAHATGAALDNRFVHFTLRFDVRNWIEWGAASGRLCPEMLSFASWRPELCYTFDPACRDKAQATARSMEKVSRMVAKRPPVAVERALYAGTVGTRTATELVGFLSIWRGLPDLNQIESDPDGVAVDVGNVGVCYAVAGALAARATRKNLKAYLRFMRRLDPEYAVVMLRIARKRDPELQNTTAFIEWRVQNQNVFVD